MINLLNKLIEFFKTQRCVAKNIRILLLREPTNVYDRVHDVHVTTHCQYPCKPVVIQAKLVKTNKWTRNCLTGMCPFCLCNGWHWTRFAYHCVISCTIIGVNYCLLYRIVRAQLAIKQSLDAIGRYTSDLNACSTYG